MAISEESRHALYTRLQQVLGDAEAATLMSHLPPVGWADVATKHDLRLELEVLENRMEAAIDRSARDLYHKVVVTHLALMATLVGLTLAAVRLG